MDYVTKDKTFIAHTYNRMPVVFHKGKGSVWYGEDGKEYIDLGSGIAVNAFGAADEVWAQAVSNQTRLLSHTSNLFYTSPQVRLAQALTKKTGMKKVFFCNSGAEANECAIKVARKFGGVRYKIASLNGSFHGRTLATLAMTGQDVFHTQFLPLPEGFINIPINNVKALEETLSDNMICALMIEVIQGEGGIIPVDHSFLTRAQELCRLKKILLMVDEIQTGIGRTGAFFAYMHHGLSPDVVTTAKGLGGGLPIGACLMSEHVQDVLCTSDHGSTFGGNPICCAGALSVINRMNHKLYAQIKEKSDYIISELTEVPGVVQVTGLGLMLGVETNQSVQTVQKRCLEKGVLVLTAKNKIRLLPPLNIPWRPLRRGIQVLKESLK